MSSWKQTYTNKRFDFNDTTTESICIEDIAHSLSNQCRYNGHVREMYSVAQHSLCVAQHLPEDYKIHGLLHDSPETYIGDIVSPVKNYLKENDCYLIEELEEKLLKKIYEAFDISYPVPEDIHKQVKKWDLIYLVSEAYQLFDYLVDDWGWDIIDEKDVEFIFIGIDPTYVEKHFIDRFYEYKELNKDVR